MKKPAAIAVLALLVALGAGIAIGFSALDGAAPEDAALDSDGTGAAERSLSRVSGRTSTGSASPRRAAAPSRALAGAASESEVDAEPASLEGTVVNRLDGSAVAGIAVFVTDDPERFQRHGPSDPPLPGPLRADSDASGAFRLDAVPPGSHGLVAFGNGFVSAAALRLDLAPGESRTGLVVEVAPWTAVSGIVVDRGGLSVPHAVVTARRAPDPGEDDAAIESRAVKADERGRFVVALAPRAGRYDLVAVSEAYLPGATRDVFVTANEETRDVVIPLLRGGTVRGAVRTPDGAPAVGVTVTLGEAAPRDGFGGLAPGDELLASIPERLSTQTNESGEFVFTTIPAGRRPLAIDADGFLPWWRDYVKIEEDVEHAPIAVVLDPGLSIGGRVTDDKGDALPGAVVTAEAFRGGPRRRGVTDENGVYVVNGLADRPHRLEAESDGTEFTSRGRVRAGRENEHFTLRRRGTIVGVVLQPDGTPCATRFTVSALRRRTAPTRDEPETFFGSDGTFVDTAGRFELSGVPPGTSRVTASAEGFGASEPASVSVDAGGTSAPVVLVLRDVGAIEGHVVAAADGAPIDGAIVVLGATAEAPRERPTLSVGSGAVAAGADGSFRLESVEPGKQEISVFHPRYVTTADRLVTVRPGEPRGPIRVRMREGGVIAGRVFDASGYPTEGVPVEAFSATLDVRRSAVTDGTGSFEFEGLAAGRYHVVVRPFRSGARSRLVDVKSGEVSRFEVREAGDGPRVTGVVSDLGVPVPGAVVVAAIAPSGSDRSRSGATPDPVPVQAARTDAAGAFSMSQLVPGLYSFQVLCHRGARPFSVPVSVPKGKDLSIDVVVPYGGFAGRVLDRKTRDAIPGIVVRAFGAAPSGSSRALATAETDSEGRYAFERLPAGTYRAEAAEPARVERGKRAPRRYAKAKSEAILVEEESLTRDVDFTLVKP